MRRRSYVTGCAERELTARFRPRIFRRECTLGIEVRAGLHTGECAARGDDIGGIGVHSRARVSALAGPIDVLVSSTLRDLVIGSGLEFEERGAHELEGVPGEASSSRSRHRNGRFRPNSSRLAVSACAPSDRPKSFWTGWHTADDWQPMYESSMSSNKGPSNHAPELSCHAAPHRAVLIRLGAKETCRSQIRRSRSFGSSSIRGRDLTSMR